MNSANYRVSLDIHEPYSSVQLDAKKGDTGREITVSLTEKGKPYHISKECYAVFTATKPGGNIVFNPCQIEGNRIIYALTPQTVAVEGLVECEIKLYGADDKLITSPSFTLVVNGTVYEEGDEIESGAEVGVLTHLISEATTAITDTKNATADVKEALTEWGECKGEFDQKISDASASAESAANAAENAKASETAAAGSASNALAYRNSAMNAAEVTARSVEYAELYAENAKTSEENAAASAENAFESEGNARTAEQGAQISAQAAEAAQGAAEAAQAAAEESAVQAVNSEQRAGDSERNALNYEASAKASAELAQGVAKEMTDAGYMTRLTNLESAVADILYEPIDITSCSVSPAVSEKGATVTSVIVSWVVSKDPVSQTVTTLNVSEDVDVTARKKGYTGLALTGDQAFVVKAVDERGKEDSATVWTRFYHGVYSGVLTDGKFNDGTQIKSGAQIDANAFQGLTRSLQNGKALTFTATAGSTQRIAYALPMNYGTPAFNVGGFDGGFHLAAENVRFTNASGLTHGYNVWLSDNLGLGQTTVKVT